MKKQIQDQMISPTFPGSDTLTARALMRLLTGKKITHLNFQYETGTYRLSGYVERLRNQYDWLIATHEETSMVDGQVKRIATYARYSIEPEILALYRKELGEKLDSFIKMVKKFESRATTSE